ncbi:MAG TPA: mechanosensitive ion channel family protein, partial [Peptococcaceae bacterium]|nr:mechanosensitive ion channel family protein [Peptococcaceae bacterium]
MLKYSIYFVGGVMVLDELGVPTTSILAGAGVLGLAVGFGAQNLVRDVLSGFFILFEDQFAVGDYVKIAGAEGTVQEIGL